MNKPILIALKTLTWIACLYPLAILAYGAVTNNLGPDLNLLVISLAITPLRKLFPQLSWLIKFRRLLGLFAFFYASIHLVAYIGLYAYFDPHTIVQDIAKRRFITAGVTAWLLLVPLALTSTANSIRRLGGKRWNQLHKLVYIAVCLGLLHYWWQVKTGVLAPLWITVIMAILFIARPVIDWWKAGRNTKLRAA